jgi:RNA polymerase sigma factor (sigma-70 family)
LEKVYSNTTSDLKLIHDYKNGNQDALGKLYKRYMHLIYGSCLKYLKNEEKSKDTVMEIYELLSKALLKHEVEHFKSWLYRVTYNHCMQILRDEKRNSKKETNYKADSYSLMESEEDEHLSVEKEELLIHLEDCIKELKEFQKNCIERFYLKEQCYNEIVEQTGYALKKVKSFIQNGKRNLMICMNKKNETK